MRSTVRWTSSLFVSALFALAALCSCGDEPGDKPVRVSGGKGDSGEAYAPLCGFEGAGLSVRVLKTYQNVRDQPAGSQRVTYPPGTALTLAPLDDDDSLWKANQLFWRKVLRVNGQPVEIFDGQGWGFVAESADWQRCDPMIRAAGQVLVDGGNSHDPYADAPEDYLQYAHPDLRVTAAGWKLHYPDRYLHRPEDAGRYLQLQPESDTRSYQLIACNKCRFGIRRLYRDVPPATTITIPASLDGHGPLPDATRNRIVVRARIDGVNYTLSGVAPIEEAFERTDHTITTPADRTTDVELFLAVERDVDGAIFGRFWTPTFSTGTIEPPPPPPPPSVQLQTLFATEPQAGTVTQVPLTTFNGFTCTAEALDQGCWPYVSQVRDQPFRAEVLSGWTLYRDDVAYPASCNPEVRALFDEAAEIHDDVAKRTALENQAKALHGSCDRTGLPPECAQGYKNCSAHGRHFWHEDGRALHSWISDPAAKRTLAVQRDDGDGPAAYVMSIDTGAFGVETELFEVSQPVDFEIPVRIHRNDGGWVDIWVQKAPDRQTGERYNWINEPVADRWHLPAKTVSEGGALVTYHFTLDPGLYRVRYRIGRAGGAGRTRATFGPVKLSN